MTIKPASEKTLKTPSVLAFERKLDPSDAIFFSGVWADRAQSEKWSPVTIREKSVRGTISNRLGAKETDPAKLDAAIEKPNLQTVDVAALPPESDTLKVMFSLRVIGGVGSPSACNNAEYQKKLCETVTKYAEQNKFSELAWRYACNLANGRFLWRNRVGTEHVEVHISRLVSGKAEKTWKLNGHNLALRSFEVPGPEKEPLNELRDLIASGLMGKSYVLLQVTAFVRIGSGQEVFPSQELILDRGRGDKSKTLYQVNDVAGIHSQKIGNAIRSIDTWYPGAVELGPIALEPYGSVTTLGKAFRQPKEKQDFYSLLDKWILEDKLPEVNDQHFVMGILIRGGVFGEKEKD